MTFSTAAKSTKERPDAPVLIFDIETVPDIPLLYSAHCEKLVLDKPFLVDEHWKCYETYEQIAAQLNLGFPQTIYHMVLSICAVYIDPVTHRIMDGFKKTIPKVDSYVDFRRHERVLLQEFWDFSLRHENFNQAWYDQLPNDRSMSDFQKAKFKKIPVTFCGYNISNFDLIVIEQRSLIHFLTCPIESYAKNQGMDSYRYKYAADKVFDLINFISNYDNRNARVGLNTLSQAMGLGGKMTGMDGAQVAVQYYKFDNSKLIEEYCAIDVLISYGVFLAVQKFRGVLTEEQFISCLVWFEQWLMKAGKPDSYKNLAKESAVFFAYAKSVEGNMKKEGHHGQ